MQLDLVSVESGDIVRYGNSVGVVLEVTVENSAPTPGCLVKWLMQAPYDAEQDWVLMNALEILREAK